VDAVAGAEGLLVALAEPAWLYEAKRNGGNQVMGGGATTR
jgi:hypothetical protein